MRALDLRVIHGGSWFGWRAISKLIMPWGMKGWEELEVAMRRAVMQEVDLRSRRYVQGADWILGRVFTRR